MAYEEIKLEIGDIFIDT